MIDTLACQSLVRVEQVYARQVDFWKSERFALAML